LTKPGGYDKLTKVTGAQKPLLSLERFYHRWLAATVATDNKNIWLASLEGSLAVSLLFLSLTAASLALAAQVSAM
jgi:hypothetical protein